MPLTAINIGAILLLILPGFLAYRFAVWRRADPTQRSPLWQVSEILEYSAYVHLIGALLVTGFHILLLVFRIDTNIDVLFQDGPTQFLKVHFTSAVAYFVLYPMYVILASAIVGAYGLPLIVSSGIANFPKRIARLRFLRWIPVPREPYHQEPVWYHAFTNMAEGYAARQPYLMVTLKSGDAYFGLLSTYPIVPDTANDKDFLITRARYYKDGDLTQERDLESLDGIGAVLLNTSNVDSIKLYYHPQEG